MLAVAIAVITTAYSAADTSVPTSAPVAGVRGLWVLRTSMTSPEAIAGVVRTAVSGGYNTLLVQVRGRGDSYYKSSIDPRAPELRAQPATFDPLAATLATAHAAGLKVHAWINVNLVSSAVTVPRSPEHVVARHPGWLMVPRALATELHRIDPATPEYVDRLSRWTRGQSESVEGLFLSPITDEAQDYTVSVIQSLARSYALDGVHLDYTRYPSADFDYSVLALRAFRSARLQAVRQEDKTRLDKESQTDPLAWTRAYPDAWTAFRIDRLTTLVHRIRETVKAARPGAILSSAVLADPNDARDAHLQNWEAWANAALLDVVCPMAYATEPAAFADQVTRSIAAGHGRPVWIGIGAWRLPVEQTAAHLATAGRAGVDGVLLFSYDSLVTRDSPKGTYFARLRSTLLNPTRSQPRRTAPFEAR
ncbi:MAG TPA: family 10 glycosylhydrolase [Vicinamibacterales bacterium]|nr:family 10 glycosylhydrolase [Vicinamibacterales bacterium]